MGSEEVNILGALDLSRIQCYNELVAGSGKSVFKSECSKVDKTRFVDSAGDDPELLLSIPFKSTMRIRGLCLSLGGEYGTCPARVRIYANMEGLDFSGLESFEPVQELVIRGPDVQAQEWYPLKVVKLGNVSHLYLHFSGRWSVPEHEQGEGSVRVYYVGLRAEVIAPRVGVVHAMYESRAQASDHKMELGGGTLTKKV